MKEMAPRGLQVNNVTYNKLLHAKVLAKLAADSASLWMRCRQWTYGRIPCVLDTSQVGERIQKTTGEEPSSILAHAHRSQSSLTMSECLGPTTRA